MHGLIKDITGKRYGLLTAVSRVAEPAIKNQGSFWLCKCDCGNTRVVRLKDLNHGNTGSCGCMKQPKRGQSSKEPRVAINRPWRKITAITFIMSTSKPRSKPKTGDVRTTKKHGRQVRVPLYVTDTRGNIIGRNCTGGRPRFEWVALTAANIAKYHLEYLKLELTDV